MMTQTRSPRWPRRFRSLLAAASAALLVMGTLAAGLPASAAVTYRGKGTQKDPYLVETAEQLNGIRNNLKAHYKLANTIDLSSFSNFEPIGYLAKPFTGSLTCDTDADGNPKYAIKNLKQSVKSMTDTIKQWYDSKKWVKGMGRMEAGLFGATKDASFTNILVLNASVENKNPAMNEGGNFNGQYYKPLPADEAGSGLLVGIASNTSLTGCAATGTLTGTANFTGGLAGQLLDGSSASNCYANATLKTGGWWGQGGLFGSAQDATVSQSWCEGKIVNDVINNTKTSDNIGGFIGMIERSVISDCYTTVDVVPNGYNFSCQTADSVVTNCYAAGKTEKIRDPRPSEYGYGNHENCYVLQGSKNFQQDFKSAAAAEISSKLVGKTAWVAGKGGLPTLSSVKVPKAASEYVPGKVETPTEPTGGTQPTDESTPAGGDASVESIKSRLETNPNDSSLVTMDMKDGIMQLKKDYDAADAAGADLDQATGLKMNLLYNALSELMLSDIGDRLQALPATDKLTIEHRKEILAIESDFAFISALCQEALNPDLKTKMDEAIAKVPDLAAASTNTTTVVNNQLTTLDWVVVGILSLLIAALATAIIWMTVVVIQTKKKQAGKPSGGNALPR